MKHVMADHPSRGRGARPRRAFTIVELLTTVAIIIILLSLVVVSVNWAVRTGQRANTGALMNSIKQGLIQFREDTGYLPPVLGPDPQSNVSNLDEYRRYYHPPRNFNSAPGQYADEIQDWYSYTTLAEYLVGYGSAEVDGHDGPGIRNPGRDGVWGATRHGGNGMLNDRNPATTGPVLGAYIQLRDERLLGAINDIDADGRPQVVFPGEVADFDQLPRVIVDYWGEPIRYYRRPYPAGALGQSFRARPEDPSGAHIPTLSDFILLRPYRVTGDDTDVPGFLADEIGDTTTSYRLQTAEFALFSSGPSRDFAPGIRFDADERNADNMVEVGP